MKNQENEESSLKIFSNLRKFLGMGIHAGEEVTEKAEAKQPTPAKTTNPNVKIYEEAKGRLEDMLAQINQSLIEKSLTVQELEEGKDKVMEAWNSYSVAHAVVLVHGCDKVKMIRSVMIKEGGDLDEKVGDLIKSILFKLEEASENENDSEEINPKIEEAVTLKFKKKSENKEINVSAEESNPKVKEAIKNSEIEVKTKDQHNVEDMYMKMALTVEEPIPINFKLSSEDEEAEENKIETSSRTKEDTVKAAKSKIKENEKDLSKPFPVLKDTDEVDVTKRHGKVARSYKGASSPRTTLPVKLDNAAVPRNEEKEDENRQVAFIEGVDPLKDMSSTPDILSLVPDDITVDDTEKPRAKLKRKREPNPKKEGLKVKVGQGVGLESPDKRKKEEFLSLLKKKMKSRGKVKLEKVEVVHYK